MSYDGKTIELNYVYARAETDIFDDRERKVSLIFAEHPYSPVAPRKERVPYLEFTFDNKTLLGINIVTEDGNVSYSSSAFKIDLVYLPGNTVEGRVNEKSQVMSKDFECEVAFKAAFGIDPEAPVTARTGKPLAAGGGAAGAAFLQVIRLAQEGAKYVEAQKDEAQMEALVKKSLELGKYRFQERNSLFLMSALQQMKDARVTAGFTDGNKATLSFVGLGPNGRTEGRVNMHLEGNQWKVGQMALKDKTGRISF